MRLISDFEEATFIAIVVVMAALAVVVVAAVYSHVGPDARSTGAGRDRLEFAPLGPAISYSYTLRHPAPAPFREALRSRAAVVRQRRGTAP